MYLCIVCINCTLVYFYLNNLTQYTCFTIVSLDFLFKSARGGWATFFFIPICIFDIKIPYSYSLHFKSIEGLCQRYTIYTECKLI